MAKFKGGTTITSSLEVSGNIVDLSGDVGTSGQILSSTGSLTNGELKVIASDGSGGDQFGTAIATGNNKIVVGAPGDDSDKGAVYVYNLDGTGEVKITASDGASSDNFGSSVSIGSNKIVVGAFGDDVGSNSNQGSAYVYNLDGTGEVKITASDGASSDNFGSSVAVNDNKIVIGAPGDNSPASDAGSAYIYDLNGTNQVKITASDQDSTDNFGFSVAIGNNKVAIGAPGDDSDKGAVYVYNLDGTGEVKITASDGAVNDDFGSSVAIGSNKIIVGAISESTRGAVYIYDLDGTNEIKVAASDGSAFDEFGKSVAVTNNNIVVGAPDFDGGSINVGQVYVYNLKGTNELKLSSSDIANSDGFGHSVSANDGKIVVGSINDDNSNGSSAGGAYRYNLPGTDWITVGGGSASTGITNYIKCVCASATTLNGSATASTLSWMSTTPSFSNGFSAPTATTITVPNDGLYLIGLNLDVTQTDTSNGNRYNHGFEIYINGGATGAEIRNNYIRGTANNSNHFDSSANATKTLKLSANDAITINNRRLTGGGAVNTLQLTTNSSIFVVQIA